MSWCAEEINPWTIDICNSTKAEVILRSCELFQHDRNIASDADDLNRESCGA
jgi:hypothetical protein